MWKNVGNFKFCISKFLRRTHRISTVERLKVNYIQKRHNWYTCGRMWMFTIILLEERLKVILFSKYIVCKLIIHIYPVKDTISRLVEKKTQLVHT